MITKKSYKKLKKDIIRQIEYESKCQCENKSYDDKFIFSVVTTKYRKPQWDYYNFITEKVVTIYECHKCGKYYDDNPIVAMA